MAVFKNVRAFRRGVLEFFSLPRSRAQRAAERAARIRDSYAAAAQDPEFLADMAEVEQAFDGTAGDGLAEHSEGR